MDVIVKQHFEGERPLFESHNLRLEEVTIGEGESAIKECSNIEAENCHLWGKYPFWHVHGFKINNCQFDAGARSALWYSDNMVMTNTRIDGPKMFREMHDMKLENVVINDADETFWRCSNIEAKNLELHDGTYPFMFCENVKIDGLKADSKYVFQYCKNVEIRNAHIVTKDSFWECENITIYDSYLDGEYLAWHSKNVRLVNCRLAGEQLLCYADKLVLENCTFDEACDRVFEYSDVQADITGHIENIKNPTSGHIVADSIGSVTIDENIKQPANCVIETRN
ncbi:DUF3737 family protein [Prevotella sp. E9-3]|uniref:DUF3737 family protein n=1 Tax=Prevotella sp. E9-3 TaxID=2913621 RepID=UPI001EDA4DFF|nr:DUF3737 family protein [Prevotella sp. E9-3]UKK48634.1 DUF3737 family protein [Prevotella sp. E9-3]